jgi:hypothetical protein
MPPKIVKDLLEGSGIPAEIRDKSSFAIHPQDETQPNLAIWIRDEATQRALTIVAEYLRIPSI